MGMPMWPWISALSPRTGRAKEKGRMIGEVGTTERQTRRRSSVASVTTEEGGVTEQRIVGSGSRVPMDAVRKEMAKVRKGKERVKVRVTVATAAGQPRREKERKRKERAEKERKEREAKEKAGDMDVGALLGDSDAMSDDEDLWIMAVEASGVDTLQPCVDFVIDESDGYSDMEDLEIDQSSDEGGSAEELDVDEPSDAESEASSAPWNSVSASEAESGEEPDLESDSSDYDGDPQWQIEGLTLETEKEIEVHGLESENEEIVQEFEATVKVFKSGKVVIEPKGTVHVEEFMPKSTDGIKHEAKTATSTGSASSSRIGTASFDQLVKDMSHQTPPSKKHDASPGAQAKRLKELSVMEASQIFQQAHEVEKPKPTAKWVTTEKEPSVFEPKVDNKKVEEYKFNSEEKNKLSDRTSKNRATRSQRKQKSKENAKAKEQKQVEIVEVAEKSDQPDRLEIQEEQVTETEKTEDNEQQDGEESHHSTSPSDTGKDKEWYDVSSARLRRRSMRRTSRPGLNIATPLWIQVPCVRCAH